MNQSIFKGKHIGNLYLIYSSNNCVQSIKQDDQYTLWHRRLVHARLSRIRRMQKTAKGEITNLKLASEHYCDECKKGKSKRQKFTKAQEKGYQPMDKILCDIYGPLPIKSTKNNIYILGVIDSFSGFLKVFFQATKSAEETIHKIKSFVAWGERQSSHQCHQIQSDNGTEF